MRIFQDVSPAEEEQSLTDAVGAFINCSRANAVRKPWSITELGADDEDLDWLRLWANSLNPEVATRWLSSAQRADIEDVEGWLGISRRAGIGCILLLLISEGVRRDGLEGDPWSCMSGFFRADTEQLLLTPQPTRMLREAIKDAALSLNLRHVFGVEGSQDWLDTMLFLQFGFTRRGFERWLPEWLSDVGRPQAVSRLSEPGPLRSPSFSELWNRLRDYRVLGHWTAFPETVLITWMESSRWILPSWYAPLARAATERAHLHSETKKPAALPEPASEAGESRFLGDPKLSWLPGASPEFQVSVNLDHAAVGRSVDALDIVVDGRVVCRLVKQPNGAFAASPREVSLRPAPRVTAILKTTDGAVVATQELDFWDDGADLSVFRLSNGLRMKDPWAEPLKPNSEYALVVQSDLTLTPKPPMWQTIGEGRTMTLFHVGAGAGGGLRVTLGDAVLWDSAAVGRVRSQEAAWARAVTVTPSVRQVPWGGRFNVRINHPPGVRVVSARFRGSSYQPTVPGSTATDFGPVDVPMTVAPKALDVDLFLSHPAGRERIHRSLNLEVVGAVQRKQGVWKARNPKSVLTTREAKTDAFRIMPPRSWLGEDVHPGNWVLMEGDVWVSRVSRAARPLGALLGLGNALTVRAGPTPYNVEGDALTMAAMVLDPGILRGGGFAPQTAQVSLELSAALDVGNDHQVLVLDSSGAHRVATGPQIEQRGPSSWAVDASGPSVGFAAAYKGARLGAWWSPEIVASLIRSTTSAQAGQVAALLRWLWTPILAQNHLGPAQQLAQAFPGPTLAAWLQDRHLPSGLTFGLAENDWLPAVRRIFWDWRPTPEQANQVVDALMVGVEDRMDSVGLLLSRVDPLLMSRILVPRLRDVARQRGRAAAQTLVEEICGAVERSFDAIRSMGERAVETGDMVAKCAEAMGVSPDFIETGLLRRVLRGSGAEKLPERDARNLLLALNVDPFRCLLSSRLLRQMRI
jgi:hypothetical protein